MVQSDQQHVYTILLCQVYIISNVNLYAFSCVTYNQKRNEVLENNKFSNSKPMINLEDQKYAKRIRHVDVGSVTNCKEL